MTAEKKLCIEWEWLLLAAKTSGTTKPNENIVIMNLGHFMNDLSQVFDHYTCFNDNSKEFVEYLSSQPYYHRQTKTCWHCVWVCE